MYGEGEDYEGGADVGEWGGPSPGPGGGGGRQGGGGQGGGEGVVGHQRHGGAGLELRSRRCGQ